MRVHCHGAFLQLDQLDERATAQQQQFPRHHENPVVLFLILLKTVDYMSNIANNFLQKSVSFSFIQLFFFFCKLRIGWIHYFKAIIWVFCNRLTSCVCVYCTEVSGPERCDLSSTSLVRRRAFSANTLFPSLRVSSAGGNLGSQPPRGQPDGVFRQLMNY